MRTVNVYLSTVVLLEDIHIRNAGHSGIGSAGPFRGRKRSLYEGGVRVPGIISWPGHVPAGKVDNDTVVSGVDWLPTVCKLAGVEVPSAHALDGEDSSDVLLALASARQATHLGVAVRHSRRAVSQKPDALDSGRQVEAVVESRQKPRRTVRYTTRPDGNDEPGRRAPASREKAFRDRAGVAKAIAGRPRSDARRQERLPLAGQIGVLAVAPLRNWKRAHRRAARPLKPRLRRGRPSLDVGLARLLQLTR